MTPAVVVYAVLLLAFAALARGLRRSSVTAPIVFVLAGSAFSWAGSASALEEILAIRTVAEVTLALILFHDAAQVRPRQIGREAGLVVRMLLIAMPLTILLGYGAARLAFPESQVMTALLLAAALAPTDAGLGAATVLNPVVPVRVRRLLNVESGLNDGLATPVVLFAIAAIAGTGSLNAGTELVSAIGGLGGGGLTGVAVGAGGGLALGWSRRRGLSSPHTRALGVLALPVLAFSLAHVVGANGFVAAFIAGTAFAASAGWADRDEAALELTETASEPLGYAVWLVFGFAAAPLLFSAVGWREMVYAVLALTAFRMVPVALALLGTGLRARTVLFVGWFGPRGLATVVFALLALESLEVTEPGRRVLATAALTVVLSVLAHGLTADVLASRYGAWAARERPTVEIAGAPEPRGRRTVLGRRAPSSGP